MFNKKQISIANSKDIKELIKIDLSYDFIHNTPDEIAGKDSSNFRWLLYKENKAILGFHRSMIKNGWGEMSGIYISPTASDIWLANNLTRCAIKDLDMYAPQGILAWVEEPSVPKVKLLKRYGFELYPNYIYRLLFDNDSFIIIKNFIADSINNEIWRVNHDYEYVQILDLLDYKNTFVDRLPKESSENWYICIENGDIVAAVNWWVHSNVLEIRFTLSQKKEFDITYGLCSLIVEIKKKEKVNFVRVNIEGQRKMTLLRLMKFKPKTYKHGYTSFLLYKLNC